MITREEALRRLDAVANELVALRAALAEGWTETPDEAPTQAFLAKCGGWEDTRSPEEIIAEIYAARTLSHCGAIIFPSEQLGTILEQFHTFVRPWNLENYHA